MVDSNDLEHRVLGRLDPSGDARRLLEEFDSHSGRAALVLLGELAGVDADAFLTALDDMREVSRQTTESILLFTPLGWAPSVNAPLELYREALGILEVTGSTEKAEQRLVEGWNAEDHLRFAVMPISVVGAGHNDLWPLARRRWELVEKALAHHAAGAYEASVPIVMAQIDGLMHDFGVKGFFSRGSADRDIKPLLDERSLLGLPESLRSLRLLFGSSMRHSGMSGNLSRHGILHGRELGYDTLINSTKVFVLLAAVVQWALPKGHQLFAQQTRERELQFAGSREVDAFGRWLDRREFEDAKAGLAKLETRQFADWRSHKRYGSDLDAMFPSSDGDRVLHGRAKLHLVTNGEGNAYWAWRETPSGFCLGTAHRDGIGVGWHYASEGAPRGGPEEDDRWRHIANDPGLPDW